MDKKIPVYAILRYDNDSNDLRIAVTVVSILPNMDMAESEVMRLNKLNSNKNYQYYWVATRYYPDGRSSNSSN